MKKTIIPFLLFFILFSCSKEDNTSHKGIVVDYSGRLYGCGALIELDNGKKLQIIDNSSGQDIIVGKRVWVKYISKPTPNICMAGETVKITALRYL